MKELHALLIALALATPPITATDEVHVPTKCPDRPTAEAVHIAHEWDCTKFYKCQGSIKVLQDCAWSELIGGRLHFNRFKQVCDWPSDAGCVTGSSPDPGHPTPPDHTDPTPPGHTDPTPPGHTDPTPPGHTDPTPRPTVGPPPDECPKHGIGVRLVHEWACTRYYLCVEGLKQERRCPHGEHFDPIRRVCDLPEKAGCKLPGKGLECPLAGIAFIPHGRDCEVYYKCVDGTRTVETCRKGMHFNRLTGECDTPENAKCPNAGEPDEPTECPAVTIRLPHETSCSKYYQCLDGEKYLEECLEGLHFLERRQLCVPPEEADCQLEEQYYQ